jgi:hypothetical protein
MASLVCCVLGLGDVKPFLVDIPLSKTVDHLKKAIKKEKENAFNHIDADQLEIWKVSDPAQRNRQYQFVTTHRNSTTSRPMNLMFGR